MWCDRQEMAILAYLFRIQVKDKKVHCSSTCKDHMESASRSVILFHTFQKVMFLSAARLLPNLGVMWCDIKKKIKIKFYLQVYTLMIYCKGTFCQEPDSFTTVPKASSVYFDCK